MKAVVFDMDGVLFDTERLCMNSWIEIANRWQIPDMEIVFPRCIGCNYADTKQIMKDFYGDDFELDRFRKEASDWYWDYVEQKGLPMKIGVRKLLDFLNKQGYVIGLASSTRQESVNRNLEIAGIRDYFSVIITGDVVEHSKPKPDIYLLACERLGVRPEETFAIEDSHNGIRSAYSAGMKPIMVPDMLPPNEEMEEKSLFICNNLLEVMEKLQSEER